MSHRRAVLSLSTLLILVPCSLTVAQNSQPQSNPQQSVPAPTLRVTSSLVFLDVTVLDKKGHPVVTGLTKDDFTITEDKKPQRIFSFEQPDVHIINRKSSDENPDGKAPVTILVLDLLNSPFEDFAYIRYSMRKFLLAQPQQLTSPPRCSWWEMNRSTCSRATRAAAPVCSTRSITFLRLFPTST